MLVLVALLGFAFLEASVTAKIVNLATNLGAIVVFGASAKIIWTLGWQWQLEMSPGDYWSETCYKRRFTADPECLPHRHLLIEFSD